MISCDKLRICQLSRRGDFFIGEFCRELPLGALDVCEGVVYNFSNLYRLIVNFLDEHRLHGVRAIVCCPYLASSMGLKRKFALFQISLCVSKTGLRIDKLLDEDLLS
ncbi:hypothetical protein KKA53_01040 [Candidatus Dependentiae bacterium]|nr:hypothetical protein [Candidatus Dependentiae bacterium]